jgi:hypothetical protein
MVWFYFLPPGLARGLASSFFLLGSAFQLAFCSCSFAKAVDATKTGKTISYFTAREIVAHISLFLLSENKKKTRL